MAGETLSISPSKIEQFRKFYQEEFRGYITEEMVIKSIKGEFVSSEKMEIGSAYHQVIEHGPEKYKQGDNYVVPVMNREGRITAEIQFIERQIRAARTYRETYPGAIFEVNHQFKYDFQGYHIEMNMYMDAMWGNEVHDQKTTDKSPDIDVYDKSLQWMIYLMASGASLFRYNIFEFVNRKDQEPDVELLSFYLLPLPNMNAKMKDMLDLYIRFCKDRGLMDYVIKKN